MKSITFIGQESGDGECFRWRCTPKIRRAIIGENAFNTEVQFNEEIAAEDGHEKPELPGYIYPGEVLRQLGCKDGKIYRFTITAEEV